VPSLNPVVEGHTENQNIEKIEYHRFLRALNFSNYVGIPKSW
jgi:hypothetical protein